jgi:hypothetical protein
MSESRKSQARAAFIGRLLAGHFACYPMMFAASMAAMSLSIIAQRAALFDVQHQLVATSNFQRWLVDRVGLVVSEAASFEIIFRPVTLALVLILVVTHVAAVPWALAARKAELEPEKGKPALEKATRHFLIASAATTGLVVVPGIAGWIIIFTS